MAGPGAEKTPHIKRP
jgi:hypothetical protein